MSRRFLFISMVLLVMFLSGSVMAGSSNDIDKTVRKMRGEARSLANKARITESVDIYLKISDIYEKLIAEYPGNEGYEKNYKHYLNQTGQVQLKYAKKMYKAKKFDISAKYYYLAVEAFKSALKKIPNDKTFQQNIKYGLYYGGVAGFTQALENHQSAPDFSFETIGGGKINLKDLRGNPVILNFWAAWCPESRKSIITLTEIYKKYSSKGLKIICLSMDRLADWRKGGSDKKAEELTRKLPLISGWVTDELYYKYGSFNSVPTVILLDKELKIVRKIPSEDRTVEKMSFAIEKLL